MADRKDDPYGDNEVDANEEAELHKLMSSNELPPEDSQDGASTDAGLDDREPQAREPAEPPQPEDGQEPPQDDGVAEAGDWETFLAKHKDKSPEDLAKLAFQQQKRANREAYDSRQAADRLNSVLERIQQARDARLQEIQNKRADFDKKVNDDPDAALREAHADRLSEQERQIQEAAEREAFAARAQQAVEIASRAIPNFHEEAPRIGRWAQEEMGFTPEEIGSIADPRMIVTLHLARMAGNMMKAGIITPQGQFANLPSAVQSNGNAEKTNTAQRRTQFSKQPARGTGVVKSYEDQLADIANMSDADFEKLDTKELEALLSQEGLH